MAIDVSVCGSRIREARIAAGMTQEQLAKAVGVAKSTITSYEKENRNISGGMVGKIAAVTNTPIEFFYGVSSKSEGSEPLSKEERDLLRKYNDLDNLGKQAVRAVIEHETKRVEEIETLRNQKAEETQAAASRRTMPRKMVKLIRDVAAGPGVLADIEPEDYELPEGVDADFVIKVSGVSMEPYLHDGQIAFGKRRYPKTGEIAYVFADGENFVKQFCEDGYKNIYLFSLNRSEKDKKLMAIDGHTIEVRGTIPVDVPLPDLPLKMNL